MKSVLGRGPRVGIYTRWVTTPCGEGVGENTYNEIGRDFLPRTGGQFAIFGLDVIDSFSENEVDTPFKEALVHHPPPAVRVNIVEEELSAVNYRYILRLARTG